MTRRGIAIACLLAGATARAGSVRPLEAPGPGPARAPVDVPLLVQAAAAGPTALEGLAALRLRDADGREVPYLSVAPATGEREWVEARSIVAVPATREASGFEAELAGVETVDRVRLQGIPAPFLKRVRLEGSADREHWVVLVAEGTIFDLPDEGLSSLDLDVPPGAYRYLRLGWSDLKSGRVPPPGKLLARRAGPVPAPPPLLASVPFARRASEPGRSRFRVTLPARGLPVAALRLSCGGSHLLRPATVMEARLSEGVLTPVRKGHATLRRALREDGVAADLRIPLAGVTGPDLDLVVEDGDNAPLDLEGVDVEMAPVPWLYLEPEGPGTLTASFEASRAPRYDLEAVRDRAGSAPVAEARWGEPATTADEGDAEEPRPPDASFTVGAVLDRAGFRYVREIHGAGSAVRDGAEIVALRLDAAVLAHAREDLGDLRLVDDRSRQIPYLAERLGEPLSIDLTEPEAAGAPPGGPTGPGASWYRLTLPERGLPESRLVLRTSGRVFRRTVTVWTVREPADRREAPRAMPVATGTWAHADPELPPPELPLTLPRLPVADVLVLVDDGDNQRLPLLPARLLLPAHQLRFYPPRGAPATLLYGKGDLAAPRYDLALLQPRLVGVPNREAWPGAEAQLAAPPDPAATGKQLFWIALAVAVAVLFALIGRMVGSPAPPDEGAAAS